MLRAGIDLLTAVAEEVETHMGGKQRQAACGALADQADEVLTTLGVALPQSLQAAGKLGSPACAVGFLIAQEACRCPRWEAAWAAAC